MTETNPTPYCLAHLSQRDATVRARALEEAAWIARDGCLVPPDGGSPTTEEVELCDRIAKRIRSRIPAPEAATVFSKDWCVRMAGLENDSEISAGLLARDPIFVDEAAIRGELEEAKTFLKRRQLENQRLADDYHELEVELEASHTIRAELVAALRAFMTTYNNHSDVELKALEREGTLPLWLMNRILVARAALARATPGEQP